MHHPRQIAGGDVVIPIHLILINLPTQGASYALNMTRRKNIYPYPSGTEPEYFVAGEAVHECDSQTPAFRLLGSYLYPWASQRPAYYVEGDYIYEVSGDGVPKYFFD